MAVHRPCHGSRQGENGKDLAVAPPTISPQDPLLRIQRQIAQIFRQGRYHKHNIVRGARGKREQDRAQITLRAHRGEQGSTWDLRRSVGHRQPHAIEIGHRDQGRPDLLHRRHEECLHAKAHGPMCRPNNRDQVFQRLPHLRCSPPLPDPLQESAVISTALRCESIPVHIGTGQLVHDVGSSCVRHKNPRTS